MSSSFSHFSSDHANKQAAAQKLWLGKLQTGADALESFLAGIDLDPENIGLQKERIRLMEFENGQFLECEDHCRRAIRVAMNRKHYDVVAVAETYYLMGKAQVELDKKVEAFDSFQRARQYVEVDACALRIVNDGEIRTAAKAKATRPGKTRRMLFTLISAPQTQEPSAGFQSSLSDDACYRNIHIPGGVPFFVLCRMTLTLAREEAQAAFMCYGAVNLRHPDFSKYISRTSLYVTFRLVGQDVWRRQKLEEDCESRELLFLDQDEDFIKPGTYEFAFLAVEKTKTEIQQEAALSLKGSQPKEAKEAEIQGNILFCASYFHLELIAWLPDTNPDVNDVSLLQPHNVWRLPIGSSVRTRKTQRRYTFHGNLLDDEVTAAPGPFSTEVRKTNSVLSLDGSAVYENVLLDARVFEIDREPNPAKIVYEQEANPEIEQEANPEGEQEANPEIEQEANPEIEQEANPEIKQEANLEIEQEANPEIEQEVNPEIKQVANPEIEQEANPEIEQKVNPEIKQVAWGELEIKEEAKWLLNELYLLCCRSRIRGIPLIQLLNFIAFDSGRNLDVAVVGGAVRDRLRRVDMRDIKDIDIVVAGVSYFGLQQIINDFFALRGAPLNNAILRCCGTTKEFGMLKILGNPSTDDDDLDIGICKSWFPSSVPGKHVDASLGYLYGSSFLRDAALRDYTINAIYVDVSKRIVHDPCGAFGTDHIYVDVHKGIARCDHPRGAQQVLRSAPYALVDLRQIEETIARELTELDVGGAFRFFKELQKADENRKFSILGDPRTRLRVLQVLGHPDQLWVRKMVRKLFPIDSGEKIDKTCTFLKNTEPKLLKLILVVARTVLNPKALDKPKSFKQAIAKPPTPNPTTTVQKLVSNIEQQLQFPIDGMQDQLILAVLSKILRRNVCENCKLADALEEYWQCADMHQVPQSRPFLSHGLSSLSPREWAVGAGLTGLLSVAAIVFI